MLERAFSNFFVAPVGLFVMASVGSRVCLRNTHRLAASILKIQKYSPADVYINCHDNISPEKIAEVEVS